MNRSFLLRAAAAGILGVALAGCAPLRQAQPVEFYDAMLSGPEEVPPNGSRGTGQAEVRYDPAAATVQWRVTYADVTGPLTGAHIHGPAGPGQNAGVLIPFTGPLAPSPIVGEARITPEQAGQLASGQWYVNLHTQQFPGGEIRGQLRPRRG